MSEIDYKKMYEELMEKYQEAQKYIEALKRRCQELEKIAQSKIIEIRHEEKSEIDDFIKTYLGPKPAFGGGASLRWSLFESMIKQLFNEKEGDYKEFIRRFARQQGLTERKIEYEYMKTLIDDGVITIFYGNNGIKWRWNINLKKFRKEETT